MKKSSTQRGSGLLAQYSRGRRMERATDRCRGGDGRHQMAVQWACLARCYPGPTRSNKISGGSDTVKWLSSSAGTRSRLNRTVGTGFSHRCSGRRRFGAARAPLKSPGFTPSERCSGRVVASKSRESSRIVVWPLREGIGPRGDTREPEEDAVATGSWRANGPFAAASAAPNLLDVPGG
jgi:hypothetical protein